MAFVTCIDIPFKAHNIKRGNEGDKVAVLVYKNLFVLLLVPIHFMTFKSELTISVTIFEKNRNAMTFTFLKYQFKQNSLLVAISLCTQNSNTYCCDYVLFLLCGARIFVSGNLACNFFKIGRKSTNLKRSEGGYIVRLVQP